MRILRPSTDGSPANRFFPHLRADCGDVIFAFPIFILGEEPADDRSNIEDFEIRCWHQSDRHLLRLARGLTKTHILPPGVVSHHVLKAAASLRKVPNVQCRRSIRICKGIKHAFLSGVDTHELVRSGERQGAKHQRINGAENRSVGADSQSKSEYGDSGKARAFAERPGAVAQVTEEMFEPRQAPGFAHILCDQCGVAEGSARGVVGLNFRCAALLLLLGLEVDVGLQLALEIVFQITPPKQQRQLGFKPVPHNLYSSPALLLVTPQWTPGASPTQSLWPVVSISILRKRVVSCRPS